MDNKEIICSFCGEKNLTTDVFCSNCKSRLSTTIQNASTLNNIRHIPQTSPSIAGIIFISLGIITYFITIIYGMISYSTIFMMFSSVICFICGFGLMILNAVKNKL